MTGEVREDEESEKEEAEERRDVKNKVGLSRSAKCSHLLDDVEEEVRGAARQRAQAAMVCTGQAAAGRKQISVKLFSGALTEWMFRCRVLA